MNNENITRAAELLADVAKSLNRSYKIGKRSTEYQGYQNKCRDFRQMVRMARALGHMVYVTYDAEDINMISSITLDGSDRIEITNEEEKAMKNITVDIERAKRHNPLDWFKNTGWKCSYEEYIRCYCPDCAIKDTCKHRGCFRRVPYIDGGLNLCPNNQ